MTNQAKVRITIISLLAALLLWSLYFIATHGRINVTNHSDAKLSVIKLDGTERSEIVDVSNGAFLSSGSYIVRNAAGGTDRIAHVAIPRWLQTTQLTYDKPKKAQTSRLGSLTYEHFFRANSSELVSFSSLSEYTIGYTTHPADDAFGGRYTDTTLDESLSSPIITRSGELIGFHEGQLLKYSFASKKMSPFGDGTIAQPTRLETEKDITLLPKIQPSSDLRSNTVVIYEKLAKRLRMIDPTDNRTRIFDVQVNNPRAITLDANDFGYAVVNMTSDIEQGAAEEDEDAPLEYSASIYDAKAKQTTEIDLGKAAIVSGIALSPTGTRLAVIKDGDLWVYDTASNEVVMANPYTTMQRLYWSDTKLYALSNDTGLNVFDTRTNQMLSMDLGSDDDLAFSNFTAIGTKLYATAYNIKQDSQLPDGYMIDLEQETNGVTEMLAAKLPYAGTDYDINFLDRTIYIRINYYPRNGDTAESRQQAAAIRKQATDRVNTLFSDSFRKKLTIKYSN